MRKTRTHRNWSRAAYSYAAKLLNGGVSIPQTAEVLSRITGQTVPWYDISDRIKKGALPRPTRRVSQAAIDAILDSEVVK